MQLGKVAAVQSRFDFLAHDINPRIGLAIPGRDIRRLQLACGTSDYAAFSSISTPSTLLDLLSLAFHLLLTCPTMSSANFLPRVLY